jgi:hypothetical protein
LRKVNGEKENQHFEFLFCDDFVTNFASRNSKLRLIENDFGRQIIDAIDGIMWVLPPPRQTMASVIAMMLI